MSEDTRYRLDDQIGQIGYVLRRVTQRHLAIFAAAIPEVTTTECLHAHNLVVQLLVETGLVSQNQLGRAAAMDAATIKGVVDRLAKLDLVTTSADPVDRRRLTVALTPEGAALFATRVHNRA